MAEPRKAQIFQAQPASLATTLIDTYFKAKDGSYLKTGFGTGFFYRFHNEPLLVTNWHVLTGRDPNKPAATLEGWKDSPTHFQLHLPRKDNPQHFVPTEYLSLYNSEKSAEWLETKNGFSEVDIAVLRGPSDKDFNIRFVNEIGGQTSEDLVPGREVCLIGFPFERSEGNPHPIWKRAMVASEPAYKTNGKPFCYLDTPGRPGMSGSPVFFIASGFRVPKKYSEASEAGNSLEAILSLDPNELKNTYATTLKFAGVYSGTTGDSDLDRLNLGRFWPAYLLEDLLQCGRLGSNPYAPEFN